MDAVQNAIANAYSNATHHARRLTAHLREGTLEDVLGQLDLCEEAMQLSFERGTLDNAASVPYHFAECIADAFAVPSPDTVTCDAVLRLIVDLVADLEPGTSETLADLFANAQYHGEWITADLPTGTADAFGDALAACVYAVLTQSEESEFASPSQVERAWIDAIARAAEGASGATRQALTAYLSAITA